MKVIVKYADQELEEFSFEESQNSITIGRGANCDVIIQGEFISRSHLEVTKKDGVLFIKDLTLANWVSYNDEKLSKTDPTQYFDFAPLLLPGNIEIKVDSGASDEDATNEISSSIKFPKSRVKKTDQTRTKIQVQDSDKKSKIRPRKSRNDQKEGKEIYIMIAFFLAIGGYFAWDLYLKPKPVKPGFNPNYKIKKVFNQKKQGPEEVAKGAPAAPKPKLAASEVGQIFGNKQMCLDAASKKMCSLTLTNKIAREGAYIQGSDMIVLKEYDKRSEQLFRGVSPTERRKLKSEIIYKLIAGHYILFPSTMKQLEKQKIDQVIVYVFELVNNNPVVLGKYHINSAHYRRYDLRSLSRAYREARTLELESFESNFAKYIKP